jgi:hypothetical protein
MQRGLHETNCNEIRIEPLPRATDEVELGRDVTVGAELALDALTCDDVSVQMLTGRVDARGELQDLTVIPMESIGRQDSGRYLFRALWRPDKSGLCGYAIRVLPKNSDAVGPFWPPLITWGREIPTVAEELVHH